MNKKKEKELIEVFKNTLLENIKNGNTNLQSGGIGLEILVKELFECEGYKATICAKNKFAGCADADVEATKVDRFLDYKIFIQVKHHSGFTNDYGLDQLNIIKNSDKYVDYKYVFITSADIPDNVRKKAEDLDIDCMDGKELVEWIYENINKLSDEVKNKLGISSVPQIL